MKIEAVNLTKKYNNQLVFKDVNFVFNSGEKIAIIGDNGSGKTTFLKTLSGITIPSSGKIHYNDGKIKKENIGTKISYCAPYASLIEQYTLNDFLSFYCRFRKILNIHSVDSILKKANIIKAKNKSISSFSTGMKQKLKLIIAFLTNSNAIFLDEPSSNLDEKGVYFYHYLLEKYSDKRTLIVASNDIKKELKKYNNIIDISKYK